MKTGYRIIDWELYDQAYSNYFKFRMKKNPSYKTNMFSRDTFRIRYLMELDFEHWGMGAITEEGRRRMELIAGPNWFTVLSIMDIQMENILARGIIKPD